MPHPDDYLERRGHLAGLTDDELIERFWERAGRVVDPLIELARTHTSPSIERSVLLRMGFSSLDAIAIVDGCVTRGLLGHGAGHVVLVAAEAVARAGAAAAPIAPPGADAAVAATYLAAGKALARGEGWDEVAAWFSR